jgi:hypothetical protein
VRTTFSAASQARGGGRSRPFARVRQNPPLQRLRVGRANATEPERTPAAAIAAIVIVGTFADIAAASLFVGLGNGALVAANVPSEATGGGSTFENGRRPSWSRFVHAVASRAAFANVRQYFGPALRVDLGHVALASLRLKNGERAQATAHRAQPTGSTCGASVRFLGAAHPGSSPLPWPSPGLPRARLLLLRQKGGC